MATPKKIPIKRMEDMQTHHVGKNKKGIRFWGYETFVWTKPYSEIGQGEDWKQCRKEYVVLHTFNRKGNYLSTEHWFAGTTAECDSNLMAEKLETMIAGLGEAKYCDIKVLLFHTIIDGFTFGLVADYTSESIVLQPGSTISFQAPWDGEYYT